MITREQAAQHSRPPSGRRATKRREAQTKAVAQEPLPLVLIVDDFGAAREIYSRVLSSSGFQVAEATNGPEGLEKARSLKPELIVVDLGLPGMDGLELISRLKADSSTQSSAIVVVTGAGYADGERKAKRAGCDAYVVKPCVPETLLGVVRDVLATRRPPTRST